MVVACLSGLLRTCNAVSSAKVTTLDGVRANKFVAELTGEDPKNIEVAPLGLCRRM